MTNPIPSDHSDYSAGSMSLRGIIEGNPWSKRRPRISAGGRRTHQDPADAAAESRTRNAMIELGWPMLTGNVWLHLVFYRDSRQRVDIDNLEKHFLDCGNYVLWVDDCQVTSKSSVLRLDRERPRTEFCVGTDFTSMVRDLSGKESDKALRALADWRSEIGGSPE